MPASVVRCICPPDAPACSRLGTPGAATSSSETRCRSGSSGISPPTPPARTGAGRRGGAGRPRRRLGTLGQASSRFEPDRGGDAGIASARGKPMVGGGPGRCSGRVGRGVRRQAAAGRHPAGRCPVGVGAGVSARVDGPERAEPAAAARRTGLRVAGARSARRRLGVGAAHGQRCHRLAGRRTGPAVEPDDPARQLLDPVADRLYVVATLVALGVRGIIPWALVIALVGREVILAGFLPVLRRHGYGPLPVHFLGKAATFNLLYAFPMLLLGAGHGTPSDVARVAGWAFAVWGSALYWWAGVLYAIQVRELIRAPA